MNYLEIEDLLYDYNVSVYPNGSNASLGAYLSTISHTALETLIKEKKELISKENWIDYMKYLEGNFYLSPIFRLLYFYIVDLIKKIYV